MAFTPDQVCLTTLAVGGILALLVGYWRMGSVAARVLAAATFLLQTVFTSFFVSTLALWWQERATALPGDLPDAGLVALVLTPFAIVVTVLSIRGWMWSVHDRIGKRESTFR